MQNEFEKQVREKMEDLDLVPSAPVWDKIEMQIRKKKDRKRLVLWIPLAFLILSGGVWYIISSNEVPGNAVTIHQAGSPSESRQNIENENEPGSTQIIKKESSNKNLNNNEENKQDLLTQKNHSIAIDYPAKPVKLTSRQQSNKNSFPSNFTEHQNINDRSSVTAQNKEEQSLEVTNAETTKVSDKEKSLTEIYSGISGKISKNISTDSVLMKDTLEEVQPVVVNASKELNHSERKLQWGISLAGGIAGEGSGIRLKSINNFDMSTGIPPLTNISDESSASNSSVHFGAGIKIRKDIGERFSVVSGLGYEYYSSKRLMGTYVSTPSAASGGVTYNEFFLNYGQELNEMKSKYHFISLPLLLQWKANKEIPLFVQAGFSVQQLIASDAWQFDKQTKVYFNDHSRLEKIQLFANLNLLYEFKIAGHPFVVGPSMQYGLSRINIPEKKRLFSLGFNAQFYLK